MRAPDGSAKEIAEFFLHTTGTATMTGDFDTYAECFHLPQRMETSNGEIILQTREELHDMFQSVCASFRNNGVTDFVRNVLSAEFLTPSVVQVAYETRLMSGNFLLRDAYPSFGYIVRIGSEWFITDGQYAVDSVPLSSKSVRSRFKAHLP